MTFTELLNRYMNVYNISIADLSAAAKLSKSTISRYKNGHREPTAGSEPFLKLCAAVAALSEWGGVKGDTDGVEKLSPDQVRAAFLETLDSFHTDFEQINTNLNTLIRILNINANDLSHYLKFDASYLSRIRSGQRRPADTAEFCKGIADFICTHQNIRSHTALPALLGCDPSELVETPENCRELVLNWLTRGIMRQDDVIQHFLQHLDTFDLNEYIRAVSFEAMQDGQSSMVSADTCSPVRDYFQLTGFMEAQLAWLHATACSSPKEPALLYSDMPMEKMSKDIAFSKKWMTGLAILLKNGFHLNIIHNIDRSFYEMMLGLESYIPLYMTGQIAPYYFKGSSGSIFHHCLWVSDAAVLSGEAVVRFHENGRYHFSVDRDEISYCKRRGEDLLKRASPLMDIYRQDNAHAYHLFLHSGPDADCRSCRNILSAPPLYTISADLLTRILSRNGVEQEAQDMIQKHVQKSKKIFAKRMEKMTVTDELPILSEEEFAQYPIVLPLADIFYEREIVYTYDEYREHMRLTEACDMQHESYDCVFTKGQPFRNIQIRTFKDQCVIISKNKAPAIHFVIYHPKLRQAIENLIVPISERQ